MIMMNDVEYFVNNKKIIEIANVEVKKNELVAIMGPSGSGKSTLLRCLSGYKQISAGTIQINKHNLYALTSKEITKFRLNKISYLFQDFQLLPYLNVKENILFIENLKKNKVSEETILSWFDTLNLKVDLNTKIQTLSGGELQRVALTRALVSDAPILLADEPTAAVDSYSKKQIIKIFKTLSENHQKTIIYTTHDAWMASHANRVLFIKDGNIVDELKTVDYETVIAAAEKNI